MRLYTVRGREQRWQVRRLSNWDKELSIQQSRLSLAHCLYSVPQKHPPSVGRPPLNCLIIHFDAFKYNLHINRYNSIAVYPWNYAAINCTVHICTGSYIMEEFYWFCSWITKYLMKTFLTKETFWIELPPHFNRHYKCNVITLAKQYL